MSSVIPAEIFVYCACVASNHVYTLLSLNDMIGLNKSYCYHVFTVIPTKFPGGKCTNHNYLISFLINMICLIFNIFTSGCSCGRSLFVCAGCLFIRVFLLERILYFSTDTDPKVELMGYLL